MNQFGRHNQLQRQPGQDRHARTNGASTKLRGADKARITTAGTRRVKPRVRPAMPQTGRARADRISASGCSTVKAGSREPLKLRITPLPATTCRAMVDSDLLTGLVPPRRDCPALLQSKKKAGVAEHPEVFDHAGLLVNGPPALPGCPLASHPTTSILSPDGARFKVRRLTSCDLQSIYCTGRGGQSKWNVAQRRISWLRRFL
jgi:hypothetical protein